MKECNRVLLTACFFILFSIVFTPNLFSQKYIAVGPGYGFYYSPDTDSKMNDVIKVRGRFRYDTFGCEASIGYKNEMYGRETVWVRSWPIQLSGFLYPVSFLYLGGGAGLYDIYIDYNQGIPGLMSYENESKKKFGVHLCLGVEKRMSRTSIFSLEISKSWIDYAFREFSGSSSLDTNSLAVEATLLFQLGVGEQE